MSKITENILMVKCELKKMPIYTQLPQNDIVRIILDKISKKMSKIKKHRHDIDLL